MLSMNYVSINDWFSSFKDKIKTIITSKSTILDFKQEFKSYCLLIKIKYCVKYSGRKIIKPEPFFLDNFISIATLDCCFNLEIKSIRNGVTIIDKKEHENVI